MANPTGFDHFRALLQQLQALPVNQQTAFLNAMQPRTPHNFTVLTTPTTVAVRGPAAPGLAIIPVTPVTAATTQIIVIPLATIFHATTRAAMGGIGPVPIPPPAPPPTPQNPHSPGSLQYLAFSLLRSHLAPSCHFTNSTCEPLRFRVLKKQW